MNCHPVSLRPTRPCRAFVPSFPEDHAVVDGPGAGEINGSPMGLLDKTNPRATRRSVIRHAIIGALLAPACFFVFGKAAIREHWGVFLPIFALLGAVVGAVCEWQLDDGSDEPDDE